MNRGSKDCTSVFNEYKAVDFYRRIPRDLTEASLSGATLSLVAATWIIVLVWLELRVFLTVTTSTTVIVDQSPNTDLLRINFNFRQATNPTTPHPTPPHPTQPLHF
ncbi:unnamed protein product [Closterium sp. NIES-54]